jgi:hypothetical protein
VVVVGWLVGRGVEVVKMDMDIDFVGIHIPPNNLGLELEVSSESTVFGCRAAARSR